MASMKVRGLIIKQFPVGDSDKIIIVLVKEYGKMTLYCKGGRKAKSKFASTTEIFTYADFLVNQSTKYNYVVDVDILKSFYGLRTSFSKLCFAEYFIEITEKVVMEGIACDRLLKLLLRTLHVLEKEIVTEQLIYVIFNMKFLQLNGVAPEIQCCSDCGTTESEDWFFFEQGKLCSTCKSDHTYYFKVGTTSLYAMEFVLSKEIDQLFTFTLPTDVINEMDRIVSFLIKCSIDFHIKSLQMIRTL